MLTFFSRNNTHALLSVVLVLLLFNGTMTLFFSMEHCSCSFQYKYYCSFQQNSALTLLKERHVNVSIYYILHIWSTVRERREHLHLMPPCTFQDSFFRIWILLDSMRLLHGCNQDEAIEHCPPPVECFACLQKNLTNVQHQRYMFFKIKKRKSMNSRNYFSCLNFLKSLPKILVSFIWNVQVTTLCSRIGESS